MNTIYVETIDSKGSRELWLAAALETLVESGVDAVKILQVCKKVGLSRTSFYWFFKDRDAILAELIELWRQKNTGNLVRRVEAYSESLVEAILNLFDCWLDPGLFDSRLEFAIRSWALQSPQVTAEIGSADLARIGAITDMFIRYGFDELSADVRARSVYLTQIGYISMKTNEHLPLRMRRIPHYVEIFTGKNPQRHELNRFYARHGLSELVLEAGQS